MRLVALVALVAVGTGAAAAAFVSTSSAEDVAVVDGVVITREAYDEYVRVFTAPDGSLRVSDADVLLSLINQVLALREADRRGLEVSDQDISGTVTDMHEHAEDAGLSLPNDRDDPGFRDRVRTFLLFGLVRSKVVGTVEIPLEVLEAEYKADPSLHILGFSDAIPVLRKRLITRASDRQWADWLSSQRSCADIRILDQSLDLPSSTPGPGCPAARDE